MADFPIIITKQGLQPLSPAFLRTTLTNEVAAINPGYLNDLPGLLIEDIASTDVGALAACDAALVDLVNSLTPYGANEFLLNQLGQIYGVQRNIPTSTSVNVIFNGPAGFVIAKGFTVSDGTHQYVLQDGGVIPLDGITLPLFAVATITGSWAVPPNTVTQIVSSVPGTISLAVNNPIAGTAGGGVEPLEQYRADVLLAGRSAATGMISLMKTLLRNVVGVQPRLISVIQNPSGRTGYEVIVGGGDPVDVAYAIFKSDFWIPGLVNSQINITFISSTAVAQVTTNLNHGFVNGNTAFFHDITSASFTVLNGTGKVVTVIDEKNFTIVLNSSGFAAWVPGAPGWVDPNSRNQTVSIQDYPDIYEIPFVIPPAQATGVTLLWNTDAPNFVSGPAVNALGVPAIVNYINNVPVGAPINIFEMEREFQDAVSSVIPGEFLSRMSWAVSINSVPTARNAGTGLVFGDPESYFLTDQTQVSVTQG